MAKRQKKKPGFMLYFEDYASLRSSLSADELVSVLDAMTRYSETGMLPDEELFSQAARICWRFMQPKMERDSQNYMDICAKRADAANKRWNANACKCTESMQKKQEQNFMPTTTTTTTQLQPNSNRNKEANEAISSAADDFNLSEQIEAYQRADDLARHYRLPDGDMSREALLEDAEKVGFDRLEEALKQASFSNNRQRLSVNFYRAVLSGNGKPKEENIYAGYREL